MSHFTVLVIGENPEAHLEPFNEEKFYDVEGREATSVLAPKWDWYELGGRWTGFFKLKPGAEGEIGSPGVFTQDAAAGHVDQCLKSAIDIDGMRDEAAAKALERWDAFRTIATQEQIDAFTPWDKICDKYSREDIDKAREEYHAQELSKTVKASGVDRFAWGFDDVLCTREEMERRARANALSTFAVLYKGVWYERGEMGWWGCVSNEKGEDVWSEEFTKLFDSLPEDTLLSIYDCHI